MPVIVLTARDSVTDTVTALDSGADDYMAKPFRFAELMARIRLRLRSRWRRPTPRPRGDDLVVGGAAAGPAHPPHLRPRRRARALGPRVRPGRDLPAQPRPGADQGAAARPGLGLRLRPGVQRRRRLRRLPPHASSAATPSRPSAASATGSTPDRAQPWILKPASDPRGSRASTGSRDIGRPRAAAGRSAGSRPEAGSDDRRRPRPGRRRAARAGAAASCGKRSAVRRPRRGSPCGERRGARRRHGRAWRPGPRRRRRSDGTRPPWVALLGRHVGVGADRVAQPAGVLHGPGDREVDEPGRRAHDDVARLDVEVRPADVA